jgi:hypothetical protein
VAISPEPTPPVVAAGSGKRLTAITIDQGLSSLSNVIIVVLGAKILGLDSFGLFAVVSLTYMATQGFARALVGAPLLIRPAESHDRPGEAIGSALLLGLGIGALVALAGLAVSLGDHDLGGGLVALGVFLPLMIVQDLGRYLGIATHRPSRAVVLDVVWLCLELVAVGALAVVGAETVTWFAAAWCGSGAAASLVLLWQYRGHRIRLGLGWLRETWPFSWRYATSFATRQGSVLLAASIVAAALGDRALSAYYGAVTVFGPQVQLQAAASAAATSEVAHLPPRTPGVARQARRTTVIMAGTALINLLVLLAVPRGLGRLFLGDVWDGARSLVWPAGFQMLCIGLACGVRAALDGMKAIRTVFRADLVQTGGAVLVAAVAAQVLDIRGTYWALAITQGVVTLLWWIVYRRYMAHGSALDLAEPTEKEIPAAGAAWS